MEIVFGILAFCAGIFVGFAFTYRLNKKYSGKIVVDKKEGKTVYTLVLDDYPEKLEFAKNVMFKVVPSDDSLDRK